MSEASQLDKIRQALQEDWELKKFGSIKATPLHDATESGDVDKVRQLMEQGKYGVNCTDSIGWTPLHYACAVGSLDMVKILVSEFRADISIQDVDGRTVIMLAALAGHDNVVHALLSETQCLINMKDKYGAALIHYACGGGNVNLLRNLVQAHNANANIKTNSLLQVAAKIGQKEMVLAFINEFGCDPSIKDNMGWSLLHYACLKDSLSVVQTLIQEYNADIYATNKFGDTPLHVAAASGHVEVALALMNDFGCDPNIPKAPVLHSACKGGSSRLVRALIQNHNADVNALYYYTTPLQIAAMNGHEKLVLMLMNEFGCDPRKNCIFHKSLLHYACQGGNVSLVRTLVREYKADVNIIDEFKDTPLHIAAKNGCENIVLALINEFGNSCTWSVVESACQGCSFRFVQTLVEKYSSSTGRVDYKALMHTAARYRNKEVALALIKECGCDTESRGDSYRSVLHSACQGGDSNLVRTLIQEFNADINARDSNFNTPIHIAVQHFQDGVAFVLLNEFHCDPNIKGSNGKSLLHILYETRVIGQAHTLIREHNADINAKDNNSQTPLHYVASYGNEDIILPLIRQYNADINVKDIDHHTPLHIAALDNGNEELVLTLAKKFGCGHSISNSNGTLLLHLACQRGSVALVQFLLKKYFVDLSAANIDCMSMYIFDFACDSHYQRYNGGSLLHSAIQWGFTSLIKLLCEDHECLIARDFENYTPLHIAVLEGKKDILASLIDEFSCDVNVRAPFGESLLHLACKAGHADIVTFLSNRMSNLLIDFHGNTPLHVCSESGHSGCVKALLHVHAPVTIRNSNGKTPVDLATSHECKTIFERYIEDNKEKLYDHYDVLQEKAEKLYSNPERITRIFVVGNPGVGKSSLIEALKREDTTRVSESTVPPHTAGIVPSIYHSDICGRVLFYDFAGDPEYYSSHAAILENLASSGKGDNIFIVLFDLREDEEKIESMLESWHAFINHQNFNSRKPILIYAGSHSDQVSDVDIENKKFLLEKFEVRFMLDCCQPNSKEIGELQRHIYGLTEHSPRYRLSREASILLGLFEKDFSNVISCSVEDFIHHFEVTHVQLPTNIKQLRPFLSELHDLGLLYIIEQKDTLQIVLNTSQLTNKVHQLLFSKAARKKLAKRYKNEPSFRIGIITKKVLAEILPGITFDCLVQLQYCQEISHQEVNAFPPLTDSCSTDQSFLFFPALCSATRSDVLSTPPSCSIGWLARCTDPCNYFPPRFLHVLLLRLTFRFTLSVPKDSPDYDYFNRCCKMWKTGVHWMGQEGVECMVELVRDSKEVVVITKSGEDRTESRIRVLNEIIRCVMEAKADFCHSMTPQCFLLDSTEDSDYLNEDNLFAMSEVEEFLTSPQEGRALLSKMRQRELKGEKLKCLYGLTHWYKLFPISRVAVLRYLKDVVSELTYLGLHLDLEPSILDEIDEDFPFNCDRMRTEVVKRWMSSTHTPPCWWHLTRALREIGMGALAGEIEKDHRDHIQLQEKLANKSCRPDPEFLQSFAAVVGSDWQSLATSLQLGESMVREGSVSPQGHAHRMLKKWALKKDATYGQLCTALKAIPLFQYN